MSVFHPANATSDGWETPQIPQSHSPATNSCATDLIPRPSVPKSQVEVGWGCILSCMGIRCIGCILQVYSRLSSSRLACHAIQRIQPIQPYSHARHTSYSAIQPPSVTDALFVLGKVLGGREASQEVQAAGGKGSETSTLSGASPEPAIAESRSPDMILTTPRNPAVRSKIASG